MGLGTTLCFLIIAVVIASMVSTVIHGDSGTFVGTLGITLFLGIMIWVLSIGLVSLLALSGWPQNLRRKALPSPF